jgi:hypothetical protein
MFAYILATPKEAAEKGSWLAEIRNDVLMIGR